MDNLNKKFQKLAVKKKIIRPECNDMCPLSEYEFRISNKMVHSLEKKINQNNKIEYVLVKEYLRSAAGHEIKSNELRSIEALVKTNDYLIKNIYPKKDVNLILKYEFLFDRFRAIRQDLIVQRNGSKLAIDIYKRILRFYILTDYKLCTNTSYDEFVNSQHLIEVLQIIISNIYETSSYLDNVLYLSIYLLFNLHNPKSILSVLKLPKDVRDKEPLKTCLKFNSAFIQKNFVRMFRLFNQLSLLCQLVLHRQLGYYEKQMLEVYNHGYSSKNLKYPIDNFLKITLFDNKNSLKKYSDANLILIDDEYIQFNKVFKIDESIKLPREPLTLIEDQLRKLNEHDYIYSIEIC